MLITKEILWTMGHRVPNHKSVCHNLHGHTYKAHITLEGKVIQKEGISDEGMVIDFSDIKTISKNFIDNMLDHGFMFYEGDEVMKEFFTKHPELKFIKVPFIPTAENIAKWLFTELRGKFVDKYNTQLKLKSITIWETPTSIVRYSPDLIS